jgi:hypothetical protein
MRRCTYKGAANYTRAASALLINTRPSLVSSGTTFALSALGASLTPAWEAPRVQVALRGGTLRLEARVLTGKPLSQPTHSELTVQLLHHAVLLWIEAQPDIFSRSKARRSATNAIGTKQQYKIARCASKRVRRGHTKREGLATIAQRASILLVQCRAALLAQQAGIPGPGRLEFAASAVLGSMVT